MRLSALAFEVACVEHTEAITRDAAVRFRQKWVSRADQRCSQERKDRAGPRREWPRKVESV